MIQLKKCEYLYQGRNYRFRCVSTEKARIMRMYDPSEEIRIFKELKTVSTFARIILMGFMIILKKRKKKKKNVFSLERTYLRARCIQSALISHNKVSGI